MGHNRLGSSTRVFDAIRDILIGGWVGKKQSKEQTVQDQIKMMSCVISNCQHARIGRAQIII